MVDVRAAKTSPLRDVFTRNLSRSSSCSVSMGRRTGGGRVIGGGGGGDGVVVTIGGCDISNIADV